MSEPPDLPLTPGDVADIVALLDGSAYQSLELSTSRFVLKIARGDSGWTQEWRHSATTPAQEPVVAADQPATDAGFPAVRAALPGTFYRAPQPGAPPFVTLGDTIGPDSVVGIIETMKVMTSVAAGVAGEIVEIVAENGQQVPRDAVLMRVRPVIAIG
jgi:acetyl-CoA carboxylase biotin carboxyl carrier protein